MMPVGVRVRMCMTMLGGMCTVITMIVPGMMRRVVRVGVIVPMVASMMVVPMPVVRVVMSVPMVMLTMPVVLVRVVMIMFVCVPVTLPAVLSGSRAFVCQHHIHAQARNALAHVGRHPQFELVVQPQL